MLVIAINFKNSFCRSVVKKTIMPVSLSSALLALREDEPVLNYDEILIVKGDVVVKAFDYDEIRKMKTSLGYV